MKYSTYCEIATTSPVSTLRRSLSKISLICISGVPSVLSKTNKIVYLVSSNHTLIVILTEKCSYLIHSALNIMDFFRFICFILVLF